MSYDQVPDEIWASIFLWSTLPSMSVIPRVCKNWNTISADDLLWNSLLMRDFGVLPTETESGKTLYHDLSMC